MDIGFAIWFLLLVGIMPLQMRAASGAMRRRSVPAAGERHRRMFSGSVWQILAGCAIALTLAAAGTACAGEAAQIAARGGFLVGHAYRCGVSAEQLRPSTQLMGELIAALAFDGENRPRRTKSLSRTC